MHLRKVPLKDVHDVFVTIAIMQNGSLMKEPRVINLVYVLWQVYNFS